MSSILIGTTTFFIFFAHKSLIIVRRTESVQNRSDCISKFISSQQKPFKYRKRLIDTIRLSDHNIDCTHQCVICKISSAGQTENEDDHYHSNNEAVHRQSTLRNWKENEWNCDFRPTSNRQCRRENHDAFLISNATSTKKYLLLVLFSERHPFNLSNYWIHQQWYACRLISIPSRS